jgi:hypothetical protein
VEEAVAAIAELEARLPGSGDAAGGGNLRSALDRLRSRLDAG